MKKYFKAASKTAFSFAAFSLVELLISLIIISILIAAFVPIITKKLKASDITVGSFGKGDNISTSIVRSPTKEDCDKLGAVFIPAAMNDGVKSICVTKYNVGDNITDDENNTGIKFGPNVKVLNVGDTCSSDDNGNCCWKGKTSDPCSDDEIYSGCNRTVCQWNAANNSCAFYSVGNTVAGQWRLPTEIEFGNWIKNYTSITYKNEGSLNICDDHESSNNYVQCHTENYNCKGENKNNNYCSPHNNWTLSTNGDNYYSYYLGFGKFERENQDVNWAFSARCVLDSVVEEVKISNNGSSGNGSKPNETYTPGEPSEEFCAQFDSMFIPAKYSGSVDMCVTKYNVGDITESGSGPTIAAEATVVGVGISCANGFCCWKGATSNTCTSTGNGDSTYSGCNRTVCQWQTAVASCNARTPKGMPAGFWRLPTIAELSVWSTYISTLSIGQGSSGLQLCDYTSATKNSIQCQYTSKCIGGAGSSICRPAYIWSSNREGASSYSYYINNGVFISESNNSSCAHGARCVYDGRKNTSSINYETQEEKDKQKICDKYNALYIPSKYNGTSEDLCVTKYNVGDDGGPTFNNYAALGITLVGVSVNCATGYCCWQGKTSDSCTSAGNGNSTYSGCNRTVCQWNAAKTLCENWNPDGDKIGKWRLPTISELASWATHIDALSENQGNTGLQLCDHSSLGYGSAQCVYTSKCTGGAGSSICRPAYIRSNDSVGASSYSHYLNNGVFISESNNYNCAHGARCVSSEVLK